MSFQFRKTLSDAVSPSKAHPEDSGFDLTLVQKIKEDAGVVFYDTGIAVQPPPGYYFEVFGRSSISKSGWMLANNVGIIDSSYRGSIRVALVKVVADAPDIVLPCKLVQMIPRQFVHLDPIEVDQLSDTIRGEGGFGSSGK